MKHPINTILLSILLFLCGNVKAQKSERLIPDSIKSIMLKVAEWQMKHSNTRPLTDWTNGALYAGVFAAYQTTKSPVLMDSMMAMGERMRWFNIQVLRRIWRRFRAYCPTPHAVFGFCCWVF